MYLIEVDRAFRLQPYFLHDLIHVIIGISKQVLDVLVGDERPAVAHALKGNLQILFLDALSADRGGQEFVIRNLTCSYSIMTNIVW